VTDQNDEFVSFDKALRDLKLQSEQLKKLVSEGEIRAFRDGQSMKFRREDVESLSARAHEEDEEELVFADTLEDDTGMVTEELSDEDTLLAEEDLLEDEDDEPVARAASAGRARSRTAQVEEAPQEPGWVTAVAILSCVVMLYGFMVAYSVAMESPPSGLTGLFAKQ